MNSYCSLKKLESVLRKAVLVAVLTTAAAISTSQRAEAAANIVLWDTLSPLSDPLNVEDRTGWKPVPSDLLALEADPPKASSDPGYYGREYSFKGDAVVENRSLAAVFSSAKGRVLLYSKGDVTMPNGVRSTQLGRKVVEFVPRLMKTEGSSISRCE